MAAGAVLLLGSCVDNVELPHGTAVSGTLRTVLSVTGDGTLAATRSGLTVPDDAIGHLDAYFYESGRLCASMTISADAGWRNSFSSEVSLPFGHSYDLLVLANAGDVVPPADLSEALSSLCYISDGLPGWNRLGIPMCGRSSFIVTPDLGVIRVPLTRLVSRLTLSVDISELRHGSIDFSSISVRQMNRVCPFFSEGRATAAGGVCDGDLATGDDLAGINADGRGRFTVDFFLMENLQGALLAGNTDPDAKTPDQVRAAGGNPDLCTYLEVLGRYSGSSGQLTGEPLTARFFLGDDAVVDFSLRRNHTYTVSLSITDDGCLRTDWKLDGNLEDNRLLRFETASATISPGASETAVLSSNLSYAAGDYNYSVSGDTGYFDVTPSGDARNFTVTAYSFAPDGVGITITARCWDGAHRTVHSVTVARPPSNDYRLGRNAVGPIYVAQSEPLSVRDISTGSYPSGTVSVHSLNEHCSVRKAGLKNWYVDALSPGEGELELTVDGVAVATLALTVEAPELRFDSVYYFLPVDGGVADIRARYYTIDGDLLDYEDFNGSLYDELLKISIVRSADAYMLGSHWNRAASGGNPAVEIWEADEDVNGDYAAALRRLSSGGWNLAENYDMTGSRVLLERVHAYPADLESGVEPPSAWLYTADPFGESRFLGTRQSWALARWYHQSVHDETFTFDLNNMVASGNRYSLAGAFYPYSSDGKYEFRFLSPSRLEVKVLYGDNAETAMPEHYFELCPTMKNSASSEVYESPYRFNAEFTVNLAVGGVAEDNNAGGCNVSLEWSFPRQDEGRLEYIEDHALGSRCDGSGFEKGMYRRLYSAYGYDPDEYMESYSPDFGFCDLEGPSGSAGMLAADSYHVPLSYAGGYDLVLWKYGCLYPASNGWLEK